MNIRHRDYESNRYGGGSCVNGAYPTLVNRRAATRGRYTREILARRSDFQESRRLAFLGIFLMFMSMGALRLRPRNHQRNRSLTYAHRESLCAHGLLCPSALLQVRDSVMSCLSTLTPYPALDASSLQVICVRIVDVWIGSLGPGVIVTYVTTGDWTNRSFEVREVESRSLSSGSSPLF